MPCARPETPRRGISLAPFAATGMSRPHPRRRAGLLVPLFSFPSSGSWGIGEIGDIGSMARWLERGGQRVLQLLPINEMPPGEFSPYAALSAMAIGVFARSLERRLDALQVPASVREAALGQAPRLAEARVPGLEAVLAESFVSSYRVAMLISAGLALLSAACAWATIYSGPRSSKVTSTAPSGGSSLPPAEA